MTIAEHVLALQNELGEGPLWDADGRVLFWVDIDRHRLHRYNPVDGKLDVYDIGLPVGVAALRSGDGFVLATAKGFAFWDIEQQNVRFIADPEADVPDSRFNDGAIDARGRFWAGTLNERRAPTSSLYRLDGDGRVHKMDSGFITPNGIDWILDGKTMYFTDSGQHTIFTYDFDVESGEIANQRIFVQTPPQDGKPDGLTVDSEGYIWSARWGGWKVTRFTPDGNVDREIRLPVQCPSSCVFGGENMDDLYITSARTALDAQARIEQPLSGDLFCIHAGVRGRPAHRFAG